MTDVSWIKKSVIPLIYQIIQCLGARWARTMVGTIITCVVSQIPKHTCASDLLFEFVSIQSESSLSPHEFQKWG